VRRVEPGSVRTRLLVLLLLAFAAPASAVFEIDMEEDVAELLATPAPVQQPNAQQRPWAVLPQVGYGPETGPVGGVKLTHRDVAGLGLTLDLDGTYALKKQQSYQLSGGFPHLAGDRFLLQARVAYDLDPQFDFFGLGNNDVGPDPASTHLRERVVGDVVFGWRPGPRLAIDCGFGVRHYRIGKGDRDGDRPFTVDAFPDLPGIRGGYVNPISLALVYATRDGVVRPTHGWRAILKVDHTNKALISDYQFTRVVADVGYILSFGGGRHVVGARLDGGYIDGPRRDVPFFELLELGGNDTLRGFFPYRFRGQSRVLGNLEYRVRLFAFDFFDVWHVVVSGAAFGEAGRVFANTGELRDEFRLNGSILDRLTSNLRYSYGGGVRFALSEALVARVDVGFSEEETGLVYLAFGHTF
jgi:outer membrane protein assembly factor BamA